MKSNFLNLNWSDLGKGLLLAVIVAVITYASEATQSGDFTGFDWKAVGSTALLAAIGYLVKNFVTNSEGDVLAKEETNTYNNFKNK